MTIRNTGRSAARGALVAALVVVGACGGKAQEASKGQAVGPTGSGPAVELGASAQLDSGNAAFRAKDYERALEHYRNAAAREPSLAAGWYGIYMAQTALGNSAAADSAMKKVQALAPGTMTAHPTTTSGSTMPSGDTASGATGGALPPGHPTLPATPGH